MCGYGVKTSDFVIFLLSAVLYCIIIVLNPMSHLTRCYYLLFLS